MWNPSADDATLSNVIFTRRLMIESGNTNVPSEPRTPSFLATFLMLHSDPCLIACFSGRSWFKAKGQVGWRIRRLIIHHSDHFCKTSRSDICKLTFGCLPCAKTRSCISSAALRRAPSLIRRRPMHTQRARLFLAFAG